MQCETISLIKFQPNHDAVDFLGNLGVFCWEIQIRILVSILRLPIHFENQKKRPLCVKTRKNSVEEKIADLAPLSLPCSTMNTRGGTEN